MNKLSKLLCLGGAITLFLSIFLGFVWFPKSIKRTIRNEAKLIRGTPAWNKWVDIESSTFISFYIFNVTNPDEVEAGKVAKLEEVGPYVYRQRRQKIDPHSESCQETVKYEQKITYWFDQRRSDNRSEDDSVNIVNIPLISAISAMTGLTGILKNESLIRRNAAIKEILFDDGFGLYKDRNGSTDGVYEVDTGAKAGHVYKFGQIKSWNGNASLSYWDKPECNKLTASDCTIFPPFLTEDDFIHIFSPDICRRLKLSFKEEVTVKHVKGYRFTLTKNELMGAANDPSNQCYCKRTNVTECQDGIIDVAVCRNGTPIVLSTPYWLDGYKGYRDAVGLTGNENRDRHETRFDIEPRTGILLQAHKRIQINFEVSKIKGVSQLDNIPTKLLFPVLWFDEEFVICDVNEDEIARFEKPIRTVNVLKWIGVAVSGVLFLLAVAAPHACKKIEDDSSSSETGENVGDGATQELSAAEQKVAVK